MTDKTTRPPCGTAQTQCTYYADDSACSGHTDSAPKCSGAPNAQPCKRANTCFSNYHSCADVTINGALPIDSGAPSFAPPAAWPFANLPAGVYGGAEAAAWSNAWLSSAAIPAQFTTQAGADLCAADTPRALMCTLASMGSLIFHFMTACIRLLYNAPHSMHYKYICVLPFVI